MTEHEVEWVVTNYQPVVRCKRCKIGLPMSCTPGQVLWSRGHQLYLATDGATGDQPATACQPREGDGHDI